jgi:nucleotide-binding universal stress UspA family protein
MQRILIATDFSSHAQGALDHGLAFARLYAAEVELVTSVFLPSVSPDYGTLDLPAVDYLQAAREQTRERLEALAQPLREEGLRVSCSVVDDEPAPALCARAEKTHADLIVIGTHGRTGLSHVLLGSVAERALRLAPCPVLTVHASCPAPRPIRIILVPTDFSEHADAALAWTRGLARKTGARVVLMHSYYMPPGMQQSARLADEVVGISVTQEVERELDVLTRSIEGCEAEFVVARGNPDTAALDLAEERGADLIVIGTRGRSGLAHVVLGSTAERIIRRAGRPVVSLKATS